MNIIPIVFAFDHNLVKPACICLSSLLMNAKQDTFYDIFILQSINDKLNDTELNKIPLFFKNCKITYRDVDETFDRAFEIRGITTPAYYRLLIPDLIPEYDKIVYSDVDVIFRSDLFEIFSSTELDDFYIAGVNSLSFLVKDYDKYFRENIHLKSEKVIYSGNLIFNSKKIREDNLIPKFKEQAKNDYMFQDMDVLNIVCENRIKYMAPEFCLSTFVTEAATYNKKALLKLWSEQEIEDALDHGIVHYNGVKPWKGLSLNFDIWWEYYRKSPFFDSKIYFDFFNSQLNILDQLPLLKRIKLLVRYFVYGRRRL